MRANYRLRKFLAGGSSLTEAHFADGGALEEVDYPASTSYVELKNLDKLTNEKCNTEACAPNVMSYFVSGCDNLQPVKKLIDIMDAQVGQVPHSLRYVRCVGFNETFTDGRTFDKLSQLVDGTYQGIDAEGQYGNDPYPVLDGTINLTTGAYRDTYDALMTHYPKLKLNIAKWWIRFEDPEVKRICVENWDKDGDGELSMEEAAAVSSIGTKFYHLNTSNLIDLRNFIAIKELPDAPSDQSIRYYHNTKRIDIPENVTSLGRYSLGFRCPVIVIFHGKVPPSSRWSFSNSTFFYDTCTPNGCRFYVPDESLEHYKKAFLETLNPLRNDSIIRPMSEYHP